MLPFSHTIIQSCCVRNTSKLIGKTKWPPNMADMELGGVSNSENSRPTLYGQGREFMKTPTSPPFFKLKVCLRNSVKIRINLISNLEEPQVQSGNSYPKNGALDPEQVSL